MALWEEDGILLSELGRRVSRDGPTITGVIDRMVKKILVKRKRGSSDRRVVRVILTAKGKSMQEQVSVTRRKVLEKITKNLSSKDIKHLESVLLKIMNNMEEPEFLNN
jgi:DNA-binding MarR family transcriptional regulator